jgi:large subunit ribosomal protein L15
MRLEELRPLPGSRKKRKRIGRGPGSGHGGTSTKGHKGQKARSGGAKGKGFEGGQMPLTRRIPKRGFTNPFRKEYAIVHLSDLERFKGREMVDVEDFRSSGLVKDLKDGIKLLSDGEIDFPIRVRVHKASEKAKEKIERAGGKVEIIE